MNHETGKMDFMIVQTMFSETLLKNSLHNLIFPGTVASQAHLEIQSELSTLAMAGSLKLYDSSNSHD